MRAWLAVALWNYARKCPTAAERRSRGSRPLIGWYGVLGSPQQQQQQQQQQQHRSAAVAAGAVLCNSKAINYLPCHMIMLYIIRSQQFHICSKDHISICFLNRGVSIDIGTLLSSGELQQQQQQRGRTPWSVWPTSSSSLLNPRTPAQWLIKEKRWPYIEWLKK